MNELWQILFVCLTLLYGGASGKQSDASHGYLGFDRNDYPGDSAMAQLRDQFSFAGYWLTPSPEAQSNSWAGKRKVLEAHGYGFLLLARGRSQNTIHNAVTAEERGIADAQEAARSAKAEGFSAGGIIFLDIEDGGRLSPAYYLYLRAWADHLVKSGFRPGVYCSGMVVDEGDGATIVTADDIRKNLAPRNLWFWVFNDACPPSPGCVSLTNPPLPSASGTEGAAVWQFVRSPRDKKTTAKCHGYASDANCYATADAARKWFLDMNVATSANPSFPGK
jgi:glycoside hydrolase-like protein